MEFIALSTQFSFSLVFLLICINIDPWHHVSRSVFQPVKHAAPMVHTLLTDLFRLPSGIREAYVRQWRRWLVRMGLELIKVFEDETK